MSLRFPWAINFKEEKVRRTQRWMIFGYALAGLALATPLARAQGVEVTATVIVQPKNSPNPAKHKNDRSSADVVVWLTPLQPDPEHPAAAGHPGPFRLVQKEKQFSPHLLVIPAGSNVEFPNEDPFFHNVFSLFNGKRFDLGLYESGTSRSVRFDREGLSYIFCNIHPGMGAVVLALSTPYYAVSNAAGAVAIHNVPPGSYRLHVWSETAEPINQEVAQKLIQVSSSPVHLEEIELKGTADPMQHHKNKFGDDYHSDHDTPY
jgi:plastocyanin